MPRMRSKRGKRKNKKLGLKKAAKAIAKLISQQEEERDRDIAQFERAIRNELKRFRPKK